MMKKQDKHISAIEIVILVYIVLVILISALPQLLGFYDVLMGEQGLKNAVLSIAVMDIFGLIMSVPIAVIGNGILFFDTKELKKPLVRIGTIFFTITVPLIVFFACTRTRFSEQVYAIDIQGNLEDERLAIACISDMINDDYVEYTVDELYFNRERHISSSGRSGSSYHSEYTVTGYNDDVRLFTAQIGYDDYSRLKNTLPIGYEISVEIYNNSGFIRSITPSVGYSKSESYEHMFELTVSDGEIIRSENLSSMECGNLMWCGFRAGESGDVNNSRCGINAKNDLYYPYPPLLYDELCLYGFVNGGYKRVSNIIYREDMEQ